MSPGMWIPQFWRVSWIPHLSSGKLALIIATFLALVFGLDDLIGPARTNAWALSWLSASTRFFGVFIRRVFHSAVMLRVVGIVSVASVSAAVCIFAGYWFFSGVLNSSNDRVSVRGILSLLLFLLSFLVVLVIGQGLQRYFERPEVSVFLNDHSEYLEARIMSKIAAWLEWAIDEVERDSLRKASTGRPSTPYEANFPVHGVFMVAWVPVTLTLILSLVTRTAWLLLSGAVWLLVFAPAQALNAVAQRTGAENHIKVGKYVALLIMSIYGLVHD